MNKINTYQDLLREQQQLERLLKAQRELLICDIRELKQELQPAAAAINFLGRVTTRERNSFLLTGGVNKLIDLVFSKLILARSGWLTRLTVPFLLKNYASHFVAGHKEQFMEKLSSWISHSHRNGNGKTIPESESAEN